jgi:polyphenol oxidase
MDQREREQGRREFLEQLGIGAGTLALIGFPGLGFVTDAQAQCPQVNPGTATAFRYDCRPIRPRRPASTLSAGDVQKLRDAYKAMRALDTSDPADPRGFLQQANVHCRNCSQIVQVHFSWQFFPWHRGYLYFHERILGNLIGDSDFRLPYWDWDEPAHRKLPPAYSTPGDATNSLWNSTRVLGPNDELPDEDVGEDVMDGVLTAAPFSDFGGTASSSGAPEGTPHGAVHNDVGGNMSTFANAGKDPIFYAHHSNVDKIWSDWRKKLPTHTNPTDAAFLNLTFAFFDEGKRWTSIKASQVLDHENSLRYVYGPSRFSELLPCIIRWVTIRTRWTTLGRIPVDATLRSQLVRAGENRQTRVRVLFEGLVVPVDHSAVYRVYATEADARADEGPKAPGYLGTIPVVLNDERNTHPTATTRRATFNLTPRLAQLMSRGGTIEPFLVERTPAQTQKRILKVRTGDVSFAIGRPE